LFGFLKLAAGGGTSSGWHITFAAYDISDIQHPSKTDPNLIEEHRTKKSQAGILKQLPLSVPGITRYYHILCCDPNFCTENCSPSITQTFGTTLMKTYTMACVELAGTCPGDALFRLTSAFNMMKVLKPPKEV
jgi:hypothetical protein